MLKYTVSIEDFHGLNVSDHTLVCTKSKGDVNTTRKQEHCRKVIPRPNWFRCDQENFTNSIRESVKYFVGYIRSCEKLSNILHRAGKESIPYFLKYVSIKCVGIGIRKKENSKAERHLNVPFTNEKTTRLTL